MAEPRVPSPSAVRPLFGFTRLSAAAYGRLRGAMDDDPAFRERVAEVADEAVVGRAGWLWLTRPEGWESDPAFAEAPPATGGRAKGRGGKGRGAKGRGDDAESGPDSKLDAKLSALEATPVAEVPKAKRGPKPKVAVATPEEATV